MEQTVDIIRAEVDTDCDYEFRTLSQKDNSNCVVVVCMMILRRPHEDTCMQIKFVNTSEMRITMRRMKQMLTQTGFVEQTSRNRSLTLINKAGYIESEDHSRTG